MKNSYKIITIIFVVVLISIITYTFSSRQESFLQSVFGEKLKLDDEVYGDKIFDSSNVELIPILDENVEISKEYVINISFNVGGSIENIKEEIVYDIALVDLEIDCELLSSYLKWKLVKNNTEIYEGSFDYKFDTIKDGRLVLTSIQQNLKPYSEDKNTYDHYEFYIWISDSCQDTVINCITNGNIIDQSNLQGKQLKGKIEVELYTESKKQLVRNPKTILDTTTCIGKDSDTNVKN